MPAACCAARRTSSTASRASGSWPPRRLAGKRDRRATRSPTSPTGSTTPGPPGTYDAVLVLARAQRARAAAAASTDKIVIVGASAPRLQDLHQTPFSDGEPMPGARGAGERRCARCSTTSRCSGRPAADRRDRSSSCSASSPRGGEHAAIGRCARLRGRARRRRSSTSWSRRLAFQRRRHRPRHRAARRARSSPPSARSACSTRWRRSSARGRARRSPASCRRTWSSEVLARTDGDLRLGGVRRDGDRHVQRPARRSRRSPSASSPDSVIDVLNRYLDRDERRDHGPRRDARRLHGRRDHGRVRRAARAARPRRPRAARRARDGRPAAARRSTTWLRERGTERATASAWASGSTPAW